MGSDQRASVDEPEEAGERYQVREMEAFHPDWLEVRDEVNYVAGWREARTAATQVRVLLSSAGVQVEPGSVWASVLADGTGVVCMDPPAAAALTQLADEAMRERQESAPKARGAPRDYAA